MKRYIAAIEIDNEEEIVGDASISYTYRSNGTNYRTDESVELKAEDEGKRMKTYEDGLNEAWKVARKVVCDKVHGGYTLTELVDIFGARSLSEIFSTHTVSEAINKIENYDGIKVGDEVTDNDGWTGVVTWISPDGEYMIVVLQDGSALRWHKGSFKKTGRHFSQIAEVLKQMKEKE